MNPGLSEPCGRPVRAAVPVAAATALVLALAAPVVVPNRFILHHLSLMLMWATMAQAWNLLGGFTGQISFGHAAFFGVGAYAAGIAATRWSISPWWGLGLAVPTAALLAVVMGSVCFRLRGPYFSLATLALAGILRVLATNLTGLTGGALGLMVVPTWRSAVPFYYVGLSLAVLAWTVSRGFLGSRWGRFARAVRDDEEAAAAVAVPVRRTKTVALSLSGALTSLAGAFYFNYFGYLEPSIAFSLSGVSIAIVLVVVLGGIATLEGPLIGAAVMVLLSEVFRRHLGQAHLLILGLMVVAVIRFMPAGLIGLIPSRPVASIGLRPRPGPAPSGSRPAWAEVVARPSPSPLLRCSRLTCDFGGVRALDHFDLEVASGEVVGVIGPNGAGKTTLLSLLAGYQRPSSGEVVLAGTRLGGGDPGVACRLGLVRTFQVPRPFGRMTVYENAVTAALARYPDPLRADRLAWDSLELTGLGGQAAREARTLTLAARKRLELARAMATSPRVLLLDETAAGLTPAETRDMVEVVRRIRARGVTIVLVEHVMRVVVELADRVVVLHHGRRLAEGPAEAVLRHPEVRLAYLGGSLPGGVL